MGDQGEVSSSDYVTEWMSDYYKSAINFISLSNYKYNYFEKREVILYNISQQTNPTYLPYFKSKFFLL